MRLSTTKRDLQRTSLHGHRGVALFFTLGVAGASPIYAADWTGAVNSSWDTGGNWNTGVVPGPTEAARFGFGGTVPNAGPGFVGSRTIDSIATSGSQSFAIQWPQSAMLTVTNDVALQSNAASTTSFWGGTASVTNLTLWNSAKGEVRQFTAFNVSGATSLSGTSSLQVFPSSSLTTTALSMSGSSNFTVNANTAAASVSNATLAGNAALISLLGTLTINGSVHARDQSRIYVGGTGGFVVSPGTSMTFSGANSYLQIDRGWTVNPNGTLTATGGGDIKVTQNFGVGITNSATLNLSGTGTALTHTYLPDQEFYTTFGYGVGASATVSLSDNATTSLPSVHIGVEGASALVTVASNARLSANRGMLIGGGSVDRSVVLNIAGGIVTAVSGVQIDRFADVNLSSGRLSVSANSSILPGARLDWTGGTLATSSVWFTVDGGTFTRPTTDHEWSNLSTLRLLAGGQSTGSGAFNLGITQSNGSLYVSGTGSLFTAGGTSVWARDAYRKANVTVADGGRIQVADLVAGETVLATATISILSGGRLEARSLRTGGVLGTGWQAGVARLHVDSLLPSDEAALSVTDDALLQSGTRVTLASGTVAIGGTLTLTGDAAVIPAAPANAASIRAGRLVLEGITARIDLARGELALTQALDAAAFEALRGYLLAGFNGGDWLGNGITSSYVAADASRALGYGPRDGVTAVVATLSGDANRDGTVNFDDLLRLAASYNTSGEHWFDGDFTYDGTVNFDDLLKLAANYNQSFSGSLGGDWALAQTNVPEPTAIGGGVASALAMTRRRRRRRSGNP